MSITTTDGNKLTRQQASQMPALLEFYSPTASLMATGVRGPARVVVWLLVGVVTCCLVAAGTVPIDKVVTAPGRIVATQSTVVVQPLETAIVREIAVQEGQTVHKGDLLAKLDPTFSKSDKTSSSLQVESLTAEVERLRAEAADADYKPSALNQSALVQEAIFAQRRQERELRLENYKQKIAGLQAQLMKSRGDILGYSERAQVATTVEDKRRELEKLGWGSQLNRLQAQDQVLEVKRSLDNAQQQARSAAGDLMAMQAEAAAYDRDWQAKVSEDLTDATRKLIDATASVEKADLRNRLVELRADTDATVLTQASKVSVGSVMQSGDQFLTLVPLDAPLEIEAALEGDSAGYVHVGDRVTVKFNTFPFTQYGGAEGTVRAISPDSFTTQQDDRTRAGVSTTQGGSLASEASYYRVNVALDKITLHDTPKGFHVTPGLPVVADVMVGKRTVLSYIFHRALPVAMDGMREP
jgi:hemolysin D